MSYPLVRFVTKPEVGATVLFDLNVDSDGTRVAPHTEGWSIGVPEMEGEPDGVGVGWGLRELKFTLSVKGSRLEALQVQAALARQVLKARNWLLFQLDATAQPVWFRTYNSQPGDLSFERVYVDRPGPDTWEIGVTLWADPFGLSEWVTVPATVISNDPASTDGLALVLPDIIGDAPAPVRLVAEFSASKNQHDIMWSLAPVPDDFTAPIVWQIGTGDGWTAGVDTDAGTAGSTFSGGSYRAVSFATNAAMATRLNGLAPGPVPPGRYKVMLRVARSDTTSTFAFKFGYSGLFGQSYDGSPTATMTRGESAVSGHATWLDLGVHSFPAHLTEIDVAGLNFTPDVAVAAQRLSGTGSARLDCLLLVPMDLQGVNGEARTLVSEFAGYGPQSDDLGCYWDGDAEAFTRMSQFGVVDSGTQPLNRGQYPRVVPGASNVLHLLTQVRGASGGLGTTGNTDAITTTTTVTVSYHPRRLWIGED